MAAQAPQRGSQRFLIAGGGTGGHLFPGLAIAEALQRLAPGSEVRFAGSSYGIEHRAVPERGYRLYRIAVRGLYGVPLPKRLLRLAMLPWAFVQCLAVLLSYRPHLVIGVGGYASGPILATALLLRRRCVIQEQNAWPGLTNRLLGRHVTAAFTAVEDREGFFRRAIVTGTPVRAAIAALRTEPPTERPLPLLFVFGGSQGARAINRAMTEALPTLEAWSAQRHPLRIVHQTGRADLESVRAAYLKTALQAEVLPFIDDMADVYRRARLVVSRAGASAVNEIVAARRAAVFIPIPGTSGDHQRRNALRVAEAGAAVMLEQAELTGERLAATLTALLEDATRLDVMEAATDALFQGDAAGRIAEHCLEFAE
ncbi:MAG TPA: undecaprenyldiphospho-muramoylpentapeptide beta-N-acetylglucosaminyltransferase [bacterium]|nr:undecaprenyldiphospho-muramoylpentapeptide beta-N-acetylglucosaminyltransferase [bacterium]